MKALWMLLLCVILTSCQLDGLQLTMSAGWTYRSIAAWKHADPQGLALSADKRWLYVAADAEASAFGSSLFAIDMKHGHQHVLLNGLNKAHALALANDGTLWLGEAFPDGLIWRITDPAHFPEEQQVDRLRLHSESPTLAPLVATGQFHHAAMTFSRSGEDLYLVDGQLGGALYRFHLRDRMLFVWHQEQHWLKIQHPDDAAIEAKSMHARAFQQLTSLTRLDDGSILLADAASGEILQLKDGEQATLKPWLKHRELTSPQSLAWDSQRHALWISDGKENSTLWLWDGRNLLDIAHQQAGGIGGLLVDDGHVFAHIRRQQKAPEAVVEITEQRHVQ